MRKRVLVAITVGLVLVLVLWAGASFRQWVVWKGLDADGREQVRIEREVLAEVQEANPELVIEEAGFGDNHGYLYAVVDGTADLRPPPGLERDEVIGWWSGTHRDEDRASRCQMSWSPDEEPELTISCDRP